MFGIFLFDYTFHSSQFLCLISNKQSTHTHKYTSIVYYRRYTYRINILYNTNVSIVLCISNSIEQCHLYILSLSFCLSLLVIVLVYLAAYLYFNMYLFLRISLFDCSFLHSILFSGCDLVLFATQFFLLFLLI